MSTKAAETSIRGKRILVAEDIDINREILGSVLTDQGHELVFANNGAEAVALAQGSAFDLILMDVQMPVMDGVEATQRIRRMEGPARGIAIFALSANVSAAERARCLGAGMTGYLVKPYRWDEIAAAIDRCGAGDPTSQRVAALSPAPAPAQEVQLVNANALARLHRTVGPEQLHTMVCMGIDAYALYCDAMLHPAATPAEIGREAHKLKGSAGTFGLGRISAVATQIEGALDAGLAVDGLVQELKDAIGATRAELTRMGVLSNDADIAS